MARQPIFDRSLTVVGYELLFREGLDDHYAAIDDARATCNVIMDALTSPRIEVLLQGKELHFNVTRELLVSGCLTVLPPARTVLGIHETIPADHDVVAACCELREAGYRIALDNFDYHPDRLPLLAVSDIVGVDTIRSDPERLAKLGRDHRSADQLLLAEKVETRAVYDHVFALGYDRFQGYFFAHPSIIPGRAIPTSRLGYLQLLREINRRDLDILGLCAVVEREIGLTYKLLRHVNSAAFGFRGCVSSVRQAILLLGEREVRKWASLIAFAGISDEEPEELLKTALLRARFCELLAPVVQLRQRSDDLFLAGLLSVIDVLLGCPMKEILEKLPIPSDVSRAILNRSGPIGWTLDLAVSYSKGDWKGFTALAAQLSLDESLVPTVYRAAVDFCREILEGVASREAA